MCKNIVYKRITIIKELENAYVQTSSEYEPLPEDYDIKVIIDVNEKIGILTVGNTLHFKINNLSSHIDLAKRFARKKGANIIVLKDQNNQLTYTPFAYVEKLVTTYELYRKL